MLMKLNKTILITGGAGFIGSHVVKRFVTQYPEYHIINLDKLTYCGDLDNLKEVEQAANYTFIKCCTDFRVIRYNNRFIRVFKVYSSSSSTEGH